MAIALEPLMGKLFDQVQHWITTRFPVIVVGVAIALLTAIFCVFISTPRTVH